MKKHISIIAIITLALLNSVANAQAIQVDLDKKTIYTDSLNLPGNTSAYVMLTLLPDMLQRPGDTFLSNYEVKIEDMSVNQASDVALNQLTIDDIEKIEVDESPLSSYNKNGEGGSINIVLRSHGKKNGNLWGGVGITAAHPTDFTPQLILGHRSSHLMVRGVLMGNIYNYPSISETITYDKNGEFTGSSRNDHDYKYRSQVARLYLQYEPNEHDVLKFNVSETYTHLKTGDTPNYLTEKKNVTKESATTLHALANFSHTFDRSKLVTELQYQYNPGSKYKLIPDKQIFENNYHSNNVSGKLEYTTDLQPVTSSNKVNLGIGCDFNAMFMSDGISSLIKVSDVNLYRTPQNNTFFVQPYAFIELNTGLFHIKATGQFQHFKYNIKRMDHEYKVISNDFTGKLIAEWHFMPHKCLRFIADRNLQRPSDVQLFPMLNYNLEAMNYEKGNPYLTPMMSHELKLDYVADYKWDQHTLIFNVGASYNHISDIISSIKVGSTPDGPIGATLEYITYNNNGNNNIISGNFMTLYQHRAFTLTFNGNVYHKRMPNEGYKHHYTYYNLSIHPQFTLSEGWHGGAKLSYFSKVHLHNGTLGDCATAALNVGKRWDKIYVYVFDIVALQKNAQDTTITSDGGRSVHEYPMTPNSCGIGVKYSF